MTKKVAISGLRHGHAAGIVHHTRKHPGLELVAVAEAHPEAGEAIRKAADVQITHPSLEAMLREVDFQILGIGDVYTSRGAQAIAALEAGKHLISDKPLCTSLDELDRIETLAREKGLSVLVQLTLRYDPTWHAARAALQAGRIGELATVAVFGRHPLSYRTGRPDWYFEPGQHGGTINDLFVHGLDGAEWLTGQRIAEVCSARSWNQQLQEVPHFQDSAQAMFRFERGAGLLMDASYTTPTGHADPWTLHFHGTQGALHLVTGKSVTLQRHGEPEETLSPLALPAEASYIADLVAEIQGEKPATLTTAESLRATRLALTTQHAADTAQTHLAVA